MDGRIDCALGRDYDVQPFKRWDERHLARLAAAHDGVYAVGHGDVSERGRLRAAAWAAGDGRPQPPGRRAVVGPVGAECRAAGGDHSSFTVAELRVEANDWLADRALRALQLRDEGLIVLGITRAGGDWIGAPDGDTVLRGGGAQGDRAHEVAVAEQERLEAAEDAR